MTKKRTRLLRCWTIDANNTWNEQKTFLPWCYIAKSLNFLSSVQPKLYTNTCRSQHIHISWLIQFLVVLFECNSMWLYIHRKLTQFKCNEKSKTVKSTHHWIFGFFFVWYNWCTRVLTSMFCLARWFCAFVFEYNCRLVCAKYFCLLVQ